MKRIIIITLLTVSLFWIAIKLFMFYESNNILGNQAVFKIYLNIDENEIDNFFDIKKGTYDKNKHQIFCKLPVDEGGYKPSGIHINFGTENINCNKEFEKGQNIKYDNADLNGNIFTLILLDNNAAPPEFTSGLLYQNQVISSKSFQINFSKGKINNLVISNEGAYDYCAK